MGDTSKACNQCGDVKPLESFAKKGEGRRRAMCKECWSVHRPDSKRRKKYGISRDEFMTIYNAQSGKCAVCGKRGGHGSDSASLCVDHCHDSGAVRGLLCRQCNVAEGMLGGDPHVAESLARYMRWNRNADVRKLAGTSFATMRAMAAHWTGIA